MTVMGQRKADIVTCYITLLTSFLDNELILVSVTLA